MKLLFIILFSAYGIFAQTLLNNPESVEYDAFNKRYFISNYGDGSIVQIDSNGIESYFDTTLTQVCALHIVGDTLYAAANKEPYIGIAGYNIKNDSLVLFIQIETSVFINDITSNPAGILFVTDYYDNKIYRVNKDSLSYSLLCSQGLAMPNGILYDDRYNRIITHSNNASCIPLHSIDPETGTVTKFFCVNRQGLDGLVFDSEYNFYFSTWGNNSVYYYDSVFTRPAVLFSEGHDGPADIFYNRYLDCIAVPNFYRNTVDFIPCNSTSLKENINHSNDIDILNYPNPFQKQTTFSYSLKHPGNIKINIINSAGQNVATLTNSYHDAGEHHIFWDASSFSSGLYIFQMKNNNLRKTKKILLIK